MLFFASEEEHQRAKRVTCDENPQLFLLFFIFLFLSPTKAKLFKKRRPFPSLLPLISKE